MNKLAIMALSTIALSSPALAEPGDAARGERDFALARRAIRSNRTAT